MRPYWKLIVIIGVALFATGVLGIDDDDDDDDGVVEDVPDENVVQEKKQYEPPKLQEKPHLAEPFLDKISHKKRWTLSQAKKDNIDEEIAKYDGKWSLEEPKDSPLVGDLGLVLKSKAKHHAISTKLDKTFDFTGKPFIVSYEVKFQNGIDCGGAYIKLLSKTEKTDLKAFHDKTPYTVMFGPDKCGLDSKLHFIFRHKNPKTGEYEEKHAKKPEGSLDKYFTDKKTHVYSLIINPDNKFEILVDGKVINSGSMLEDFSPPVNPPKEIDDLNDKKPEEWDEREKIEDPEAVKPEDWDESEPREIVDENAMMPDGWLEEEEPLIADPDAQKPEDWDEEMDGEWEAPLVDNPVCKDAPGCGPWTQPMKANPKYKGKWRPSMIDNPNYKGVWKPKRIPNPDWFEDLQPYKLTPVDALGLELWSMSDDIVFDNFLITDNPQTHASWIEQTWERKSAAEHASAGGIWNTLMSAANDKPWLYAVYVVVFLLPIILISFCLCPRSGPIKEEDIAARKKTDEATPDDEGEAPTEESTVGPGGDSPKKAKKSKAALEEVEDDNDEDEGSQASQGEDGEEEEEEQKEETDSPRRSARKRKPRKE